MSDQQLDENKLIAERRAKLSAIRETCRANGFPNSFRRENYADELQQQFGELDKETLIEQDNQVSIAGRIMAKRGPFLLLQDMTGRIQAYADKDTQKDIKARYGSLDIGDIIGVAGALHKSGKGDLYVNMSQYELLTKSLRPLPEKFHGLTDQETKYRQRYVDLITSEKTRETFVVRSKIVNGIRNFLTTRNYIEVETPMLQVIPGGATAKPFVTHHNSLDIDMYLRIAPELYLKRLVVGGFERVFEINRNFRNEGLSTRHNPEFTMLEFYQAYADYNDLMNLTEDMLRTLAEDILGTAIITNTTKDAEGNVLSEVKYDFGKPFDRLSMGEAILKYWPEANEAAIRDPEAHLDELKAMAKQLHIKEPEVDGIWGAGKYLCEIFEATAENVAEELEQPLDREGDIAVVADKKTVIGGRQVDHDLSALKGQRLRTHGSLHEAQVPFVLSDPLNDAYARKSEKIPLRSHQIFDFAINGLN